MTHSQLEFAIERYEQALEALNKEIYKKDSQDLVAKVLAVLIARNFLRELLTSYNPIKTEILLKIYYLDEQLKSYSKSFTRFIDLENYRSLLTPSADAWWWFFESPHWWDKFDVFWDIVTIVWITASLTLTANIATLFLGSGSSAGSLAGIATSLVGLISVGGALTKPGKETIERVFKVCQIPKKFWQETRFILATLLLGGLICFNNSLPKIAIFYNDLGVKASKAGNLWSAKEKYELAIRLAPDYAPAHYNLGFLCEKLQDLNCARTEYQIAVQGGLGAAYSTLARLYILENRYSSAASLLQSGLTKAKEDVVKIAIYKNLGWARLEQKRYQEAKTALEQAINISGERNKAAAYCLLAQVLDKQNNINKSKEANEKIAKNTWEKCLISSDPTNPDEDKWIGMARQRLAESEDK